MSLSIEQKIREHFLSLGFDSVGFSQLERPLSLDIYKEWLKRNHHGDMSYLEDQLEAKESPQILLAEGHTAIVLTKNYVTHPWPTQIPQLPIARYALGSDYHWELKELLNTGVQTLKAWFSDAQFVSFVDSGPVLERDLAYRAGLGWVGKNTCLIDQNQGSFFFIASIYTSLTLSPNLEPAADRCGTCTRCIDACPTQALEQPRSLNATKCISYWTIEAKSNAPRDLRDKIDLYFGCDICQDVCPWNGKPLKVTTTNQPTRDDLVKELRGILQASGKTLEKRFHGTPLTRTRPWGHKRNAIVLAANKGLNELTPEILELQNNDRFKDLVNWALEKFDANLV